MNDIKPDILNADDIMQIVPQLRGKRKFVEHLIHWLKMDKLNEAHAHCCNTPGPRCATRLLAESFNIKLRIDGQEVLDNLPEGAFITVSNHPFGAIDGISLISLIGERRPAFKVMVNMFLNHIQGMRPSFIAVDAWAQKDPSKKAVSINGIRQAIGQLKAGEPVGFFPAGAMSKTTWRPGNLQDRPWQDSVLQIIYRAKVPIIPIYFHGRPSRLFNIMGHLCWQLRSLMLPSEVVRKMNTTLHISIGQPITLEEQMPYRQSAATLGAYLRQQTYALRALK